MPHTSVRKVCDKPSGTGRRTKGNSLIRKCCIKLMSRWPIIDPRESLCLEKWDRFMFFILVVNMFGAPYETAFMNLELHGLIILTRFGDIMFIFDMALQLFTAEPDPKRPGFYIKDPLVMFVGYLTGWFLLDLATVVPSFLEYYLYWGAPEAAPRIFRLVRLARVLRLRHVYQIGNRMNSSLGLDSQGAAIAWGMFVAFVCAHWMACIWGGVAFQAHTYDKSHTWIAALQSAKGGDDDIYITGSGVYMMSLYWAIVTLTGIGYGDIVPQTEIEYWLGSACMMIMAFTWAYVIGEICGVVATLNPHAVKFNQNMDDINWLMRENEFPTVSRKAFRRYWYESINLQRLEQQKPIINRMSPMLQGEVSMYMLGSWVDKVPYLKIMPSDILCIVARKLTPALYCPQEIVPNERALFAVHRGMCCNAGKILMHSDVWGEDVILSNPALRKIYRVRCLSYLEVLTLRYPDLLEAVKLNWPAQRQMRWSAVKLSTMRAFNLLGRGAGIWNGVPGVKPFQTLTLKQMKRFIQAVLKSEFDFFGMEQKLLERHVLALNKEIVKAECAHRTDTVPALNLANVKSSWTLGNLSPRSWSSWSSRSAKPKVDALPDLYRLLLGMQEKIKHNENEIMAMRDDVFRSIPI